MKKVSFAYFVMAWLLAPYRIHAQRITKEPSEDQVRTDATL